VNLILFTASYPYVQGGESNFLTIELQHLFDAFDHIWAIPETLEVNSPVTHHANLHVDTSYAHSLSAARLPKLIKLALFSKIFWCGVFEVGFPRFSVRAWRRLIAISGKAELTRRWVLRFIQKEGLDPKDTVFYTYWFDHATTGVAFTHEQHPELCLITRAHGYDIYAEEYYDPPFFPCRQSALPMIDLIFTASKAGMEHLKNCYPEFSSRIQSALLGVIDPGFITQPSRDGVFRIVSCSMIRPEKRIEFIFDTVKYAAEMRPDQKIEWYHVGNGITREELQKQAKREYPSNAKAFFLAYSDHESLMHLYQEKPLDLFVNLSTTEGTPVSIMEAISCGIPVLATAVGGNTEIVTEQNGFLVEKDASLKEITDSIFKFIDEAEMAIRKRMESRKVWEMQYNANLNFSEFTRKLKQLRVRQGE
jgi:glycosyltransferase involved in cell wall biosynthesis